MPKQLDSFEGGPNQKFESRAQLLGLSTNSSELLDYLQSGFCEDLLKNNKLKTHIETGNIYYDNNDTNESIYGFFQQQEDETKKWIDFEFVFGDSYQGYKYLLKINQKTMKN